MTTVNIHEAKTHFSRLIEQASAGQDIVIELPQSKVGKVKWTGTLTVVFADETQGSMPLAFGTEVLGGFKFSVKDEDVNLTEHSIVVTDGVTGKPLQALALGC